MLTDTGNWCRQAKEAGAEFVLFPELLIHGHCTPNTWDLAEAIPDGPSTARLVELAREYQLVLYLEAARMMERKMPDDVVHIHVSYLPIPPSVGEMKTKPAQYSVRTLNAAGTQPDFLNARSPQPVDAGRKAKLA